MKIPVDFICEWDSSLGLQLACQVCFPAAPCLWWHPPSCLPTGLGLPCAAQVAFIHPLLYFLLAEARWALTSRACECTVPCNPIGHVHCACYRLGPVYSTGLCFRSRRLMRRDMVQRAVLWESPVLLCFTQGIALAPCCCFGGCSEHSRCVSTRCASPVRHPGVLSWQHSTERLQHLHVWFPISSLSSSASSAVWIPVSGIQGTIASDGELYTQGGKELSPKKGSERKK